MCLISARFQASVVHVWHGGRCQTSRRLALQVKFGAKNTVALLCKAWCGSQAQIPSWRSPNLHLQSDIFVDPAGAVLFAGQLLQVSKPRSSLNLLDGHISHVAPLPNHPGKHLQSSCGKNLLGVTFRVPITSLQAWPAVSSLKACMCVVFITPSFKSSAASSWLLSAVPDRSRKTCLPKASVSTFTSTFS